MLAAEFFDPGDKKLSVSLRARAECWRLNKEQGWTQEKIARVKDLQRTLVAERCKWHQELPNNIKLKVSNGIFDEGHIREISGVCLTLDTLSAWLTTEQAQIELTEQILDKHRGSSARAPARNASSAKSESIQKPRSFPTNTTARVGRRSRRCRQRTATTLGYFSLFASASPLRPAFRHGRRNSAR